VTQAPLKLLLVYLFQYWQFVITPFSAASQEYATASVVVPTTLLAKLFLVLTGRQGFSLSTSASSPPSVGDFAAHQTYKNKIHDFLFWPSREMFLCLVFLCCLFHVVFAPAGCMHNCCAVLLL
jgi:hypothetical protein